MKGQIDWLIDWLIDWSHSIIFFFFILFCSRPSYFLSSFILVAKIIVMLFNYSFLFSNHSANCEYNLLGKACGLEQAVLIFKKYSCFTV